MKGKMILLAASLLFVATSAAVAATDVFHFALSRSAPAADATVAALEEVRLWFTEAPQANSVGIRVIDPAGEALATAAAAADPDDALAFFVRPAAPLSAGAYTVSWRGIGDDGHAVTGEFGFSVTAQ